ncbi:hypothetical protein N7468_002053 [Penicillium chermesinum]|uniref:Chromosome segregation protein BIR1 n=1 Tax=Penicillium chermesinum TaxID=63820 RepID=A0A9W9PHR4_9EURO|nr:uncharacterized protein N7468_002053 [Penicillium chermesinum]KAJ5247070.1 hypothetical protein N7468_002053 [Penicillium chermesinum]
MSSEMDTFSARLASFDTVLKPERRRSSTTKSSQPIAWPHQKPSPAELAHAGFYYKPYETNPDNTTCFECGRALDGWEEDDNPVTEHLKHSPDCGWAIIMDIQQNSSNPATIEDPTSERITQARLATFGSAWPHDGKRGWVCQSDKMVASGWYFCPTDESDDLASCPYCKLSLDGWEPQDDPFDEHYRRSSDCSFFVFAQPPGKKGKGSRSKKARTSKASSSRLSTQSVANVASEAPDLDMDDSMDQSIMSQSTVKNKSTKKGSKGKGKGAKAKKDDTDAEGQMEVDAIPLEQEDPPKPKRTGRGKKRVSDEMADDERVSAAPDEPAELPTEPPSKRRHTKTRESSISQPPQTESKDYEMQDIFPEDAVAQEEEPPKKGRKGTKKGASKTRKDSDVSITSNAAIKTKAEAKVPQDSELDAALEAGLEADEPDAMEIEPHPEPEPEEEPAPAPAPKKSKSSKKAKAAVKSAEPVAVDAEDPAEHLQNGAEDKTEPDAAELDIIEEPPKTKSTKSSKKKGTKKSKKDDAKAKRSTTEELSASQGGSHDMDEHEAHESFVSVEIDNRKQEAEAVPDIVPQRYTAPKDDAEFESLEKSTTKKASRKDEKHKKSKKPKKQGSPRREPEPEPEPEPTPQPEEDPTEMQPDFMSPSVDDGFETPDELADEVDVVRPEPSSAKQKTPVPPKTAKRYSDIPQEEHYADFVRELQEPTDVRSSQKKSSVKPSPAAPRHSIVRQNTPSMSPQSSDAENKPPSSRLSASRQALPPVSIEPGERTPLAAKTPSPSKRNFNGGFAASGQPWTPVDIEEALFGEASDKENADISGLFNGLKGSLTSPERKMTVEEWIHWNAKNGEERLKRECERLVGQFEKEGGRAMQRLQAIECTDL